MATEQALREKLMERAEQHKYARELFEILNSDGFLPAKDLRDRTHLMQSKLDKGKENVSSTIRTLEQNKQAAEGAVLTEYRAAMEVAPTATFQPSMEAVKDKIRGLHTQANEMERDLNKLEAEKRIMEFHKKQYKLLRKFAQVKFDTASTEKHVKGYLHRPNGTYKTFEFDFGKDSPCTVADYFWDSISDS